MSVQHAYLGMGLTIEELDQENLAYFRYCSRHQFHLQRCDECQLLRYPPTTGCPWCSSPRATWCPVAGTGAVHSYTEIRHAIQPAFRTHTPYMVLIVDLDEQNGTPNAEEALRIVGNLTNPDGALASAEEVRRVGIGTRVRMVFSDVGEGLALPQWTFDEAAEQPASPWRYPQE